VRVITPGSRAGELLHVLSSLERRSERWNSDLESALPAFSAAVSLLLPAYLTTEVRTVASVWKPRPENGTFA
jgi:hypothetical protein